MQLAAVTISTLFETWQALYLLQANDAVLTCKVRSCLEQKGRSKSSRIILGVGDLPNDIAQKTGLNKQLIKESLRYFLVKKLQAAVDIGPPVASMAESKLSKKVEHVTKKK